MNWSRQQNRALASVDKWLKDKSRDQVYRLFGYAGTGKSTLAKHIAKDVKKVLFAAFTGKAALVMRRKGCAGASTIHSMIYALDEDSATTGDPKFVLDPDSAVKDADLVIIDECSMVGETLARDLLSFGKRVLVLGDPAQLPPVKDAGFFTNGRPDTMLTEIHRQAQENPIIRLSMTIREGGNLERGDFGAAKVIGRKQVQPTQVLEADQVLVGLNRTRTLYNGRIRELLGYSKTSPYPVVGERLICLRNDRPKGLFNGGMWTVKRVEGGKTYHKLRVAPEDTKGDEREVSVHRAFFEGGESELTWQERKNGSEFTFGHAVTVHKSQGSQWDHVLLFNESGAFRDDARRWLYTGVTRAAERITIVQ